MSSYRAMLAAMLGAFAVLCIGPTAGFAQGDYPSRAITLIVPFAAYEALLDDIGSAFATARQQFANQAVIA